MIPSAILTGDWHLREDIPICRIDDFWEVQWKKVDFISNLQKKYNCPVLHSGDLFNHWKPSPYLLATTIEHLPNNFWTIFGNHDLPQHNLELANKCGINVLQKANKLQIINRTHWGQIPKESSYVNIPNTKRLLVWHIMTYTGNIPWPNCPDSSATKLLKKYPQYKLILTGHNHKSFTAEFNGRLLVNPGSISRQSADQIDHLPCIFLWYADTNTVEPIYLPIEEDAVSKEHIEQIVNRDNRIEAFVSKLNTDWECALSFEENLERLIENNKIRNSIKQIIYKSLD